jgi:FkbM family methyltransferase
MAGLNLKNMIQRVLLTQPKLWVLAKEILRSKQGKKDAEEAIVPFLVRPDTVAVDIGANLGIYTKIMLTRTQNVICIEPNPECCSILRKVFGKKVNVITGAASNMNADVLLRIPNAGIGYATVEEANARFAGAFKSIHVPAFKIDDLRLENVSFIKIDVEGHELSVLEGAGETLKKSQPAILLEAEERNRPGAVASVREFLESLGYHGYMLEEGTLVSIHRFDPDIHQNSQAAQRRRNKGTRAQVYINNFIFLPATAGAVPMTCNQ